MNDRPVARKRNGKVRVLGAQGADTREKLLDAARDVFRDRTYISARVDDITDRAGVSHGAFYLYFASKAEALEALAVQTAERMYALAEKLDSVDEGVNGYEQLKQWIGEFFDAYEHDAPVLVAWMSARPEDDRFDKLGREVMAHFAGRISKTMQRSLSNGTQMDPGVAATALVAMLERLGYYMIVRGGPLQMKTVVETTASIWHQAIFGKPHKP